MHIHSIAIEEGCDITVGEYVSVDYDTMNGYYKGDSLVTDIHIDWNGRVEVNIGHGDDGAWISVEGVLLESNT